MTLLQLSNKERNFLETVIVHADDAKQLRRAQALLWLDEGDTMAEVAERLRLSRQTIYNWILRFTERRSLAMGERLADGDRGGRPPTARGIIDPLIDEVIEFDPRTFGYRATVWTAWLLKRYLSESHHIAVSERSISRAIARLDLRWKRPRHQLAQRPATWRQAKGGSSGG